MNNNFTVSNYKNYKSNEQNNNFTTDEIKKRQNNEYYNWLKQQNKTNKNNYYNTKEELLEKYKIKQNKYFSDLNKYIDKLKKNGSTLKDIDVKKDIGFVISTFLFSTITAKFKIDVGFNPAGNFISGFFLSSSHLSNADCSLFLK